MASNEDTRATRESLFPFARQALTRDARPVVSDPLRARALGELDHAENHIDCLINGLVCSNCGEGFDGDPENMGSDCCSCELVPAHALPSILKAARVEIEELEARLMAVDDAIA